MNIVERTAGRLVIEENRPAYWTYWATAAGLAALGAGVAAGVVFWLPTAGANAVTWPLAVLLLIVLFASAALLRYLGRKTVYRRAVVAAGELRVAVLNHARREQSVAAYPLATVRRVTLSPVSWDDEDDECYWKRAGISITADVPGGAVLLGRWSLAWVSPFAARPDFGPQMGEYAKVLAERLGDKVEVEVEAGQPERTAETAFDAAA